VFFDTMRKLSMVSRIRAFENKIVHRPELSLDAIHPRSVGGGKYQPDAVAPAPGAYLFLLVRCVIIEYEQ
jgi:hypothetical protein